MAAYAQLITHTPEQIEKWKEVAPTNPSRVIRALRLAPGRSTKEGDHQGDIYPALEVVKEISIEGRSGTESKAWVNLVDARLAEALCKNVTESVMFLDVLPNMPVELLEKAKKEIQSPYFRPLEILCNAACCFHYPPTKTDKKVIAALRKYWSQMMDRIWNEPENTLEPSNSHILERMVIAQMVIRLVVTDPTFLSTFYDPSDLTVQIIARHWKYSQTAEDVKLTAAMLTMFLQPDHPRHVAYVRSNDLESATSQLLSKMLVGVGPTALASKQKQTKALMASFADHLVRLSGRSASAELDFFACIISVAKKDDTEPEITNAALKSTPLWNAMFRLLKKSAKPTSETFHGQPIDPETEKTHRLYVMANVVGTTTNILHDASFEYPRECEPLIRIWANENLFGALEETIEFLVDITGMTMQLGRLAGVLETVLGQGTPALRQLFRTQFPRWRTLGTLIRHDIKRQRATGPPKPIVQGKIPPPDSNVWDHGAWQCFAALQASCIDLDTACGKRGCENIGTRLCTCEVVRYCSEGCQNKDMKDHQIMCGHMQLLEHVVGRSKNGSSSNSGPPSIEKKGSARKSAPVSSSPRVEAVENLEDLD
ncbi:hypothetical protein D9615_009617 [Tricholomella constricta]|uniref:MYND-type domain-containing protein n=1 Tax=Tricholomella constricta TaxID=117010 RepID=A0A8H5GUU9_9AGAR|nr:hypothetical protein D9615_009617 [Tricholomella constricta]